MLQQTTPEVFCEFLLNIHDQGPNLCLHNISKFWVEQLNHLVKRRLSADAYGASLRISEVVVL